MSKKRTIEEKIKESEEFDKIMINLSKGEDANCPRCGTKLKYKKGDTQILCEGCDFYVIMDFKRV